MGDIVVHRPPRRPAPERAPGPVRLVAPPALTVDRSSGWTYALFPVLGSAGLLVMALVNGNPLLLIAGAVFVLGSLGMGVAMWAQVRRRTRGQTGDGRIRYFEHLADVRDQLRSDGDAQLAAARDAAPAPSELVSFARTARLWERRRGDEDFLVLRIGTGAVPAEAVPALGEVDPTQLRDPAGRAGAERLLAAHALVADHPVSVAVGAGTTAVVGPPERTRAFTRALLGQLAVLHAPEDVRVALCLPAGPAASESAQQWAWATWLPHLHHPDHHHDYRGGGGERLLVAAGAAQLLRLLGPEVERRRTARRAAAGRAPVADDGPALLVIVDGWVGPSQQLAELDALGIAQLHLVADALQVPSNTDRVLHLHPAPGRTAVEVVLAAPPAAVDAHDVVADELSLAEADVLARALAPLRLSARSARSPATHVTGLSELLGVDDVGALDPALTWAARAEADLLTVPVGVDLDGRPVVLDLKESALGGMGPHGLAVGATGSGKSELLRTVVTGLAVTHSPDDLALVLVDYKGGATFAGLGGLPHVAGSVTDLEDDPSTIDRVAAALRAELRRREEVLRASGDLASIREHRRRRLAGADVPALPHLLVVVDEFSELLAQQPDLADVFVAIGRLGRSLGVHLLLATQRLEEGRLRGLDSHLSYRLALRTFSASESRAVIGSADAFELPPAPGSAYLKVDTTVYQRLRVATVSGPYVEPARRPAARADLAIRPLSVLGAVGQVAGEPAPLPPLGLDLSDPSRRSVLDVVVSRLAGAAARVHQVWLPPLPAEVALAALVGPLHVDPARGLSAAGPVGQLRAPLGVVDLPDRQRQEAWAIDLGAAGGHVGIAGAPASGKTALLRTLVTSLALTHPPDQVQVHVLDLAGGGLAGLAALPSVGTVATRAQPDLVRRVVAQVGALVDQREADHGPGPERAHVLLVVDGWSVLRADFEDLEAPLTALAARGAAVGVHLVVASGRWFDLRPAVRDLLGTKLELRLGEPADSLLDRAAARALPAHAPGRVLVAGPGGARTVQVAWLPPAALAVLGERSRAAWSGSPAAPVVLLPARVDLDDVPAGAAGAVGVVIGVRERDLGPARVDLLAGPDPHLLVIGDVGSGKSAALRTVVRSVTAATTPEELLVVVVDYRRALLDAVPAAYLSQYCASAPAAAGTIAALAEKLIARMPGPDVTREQLRARSWWSGPRALVVVDDHDLVAAPSGDPLAPLVELLPVAADIGLHVVLARSAGGAGMGMHAPLVRRLRELGTPGLLLSGPREEGVVLHGSRLSPLPPGRALHVQRAAPPSLVQVAWTPHDLGPRAAGADTTDQEGAHA